MKRFVNRALFSCALTAALVAGACSGLGKKPPEPQWQVSEIEVPSHRVLWEYTSIALEKEGYPVGSGFDPAGLTAASGWRTDAHPFRGKGYRIKAEVQYEPAGPGRFQVRVRVSKQNNMDIVRPTDLSYADWQDAPDDVEAAKILLLRIKAYMGSSLPVGEPEQGRFGGG